MNTRAKVRLTLIALAVAAVALLPDTDLLALFARVLGVVVGLWIGTVLWDYYRREERLAALRKQAAEQVGARRGYRVDVEVVGRRFTVSVTCETGPAELTVYGPGNPCSYDQTRAWLAGIHAGDELANYQRERFGR